MIVKRSRCSVPLPPMLPGITRVKEMNILGIKIQDNLSMEKHISDLVTSANQNLYALKILKTHGLPISSIYNVCSATLVSRLTYAAPARFGFTNSSEKEGLQAVLNKATR